MVSSSIVALAFPFPLGLGFGFGFAFLLVFEAAVPLRAPGFVDDEAAFLAGREGCFGAAVNVLLYVAVAQSFRSRTKALSHSL